MAVVIRASRTSSWPTADGIVTTSEVVVRNASYFPDVVYSYAVGGKTYYGTEIELGVRVGSDDGANAATQVGRYPVGTKVTVFFNPEAPETAVLQPGISKRTLLPLVLGVGFAGGVGWSCLLIWLSGM